MQYRVFQNSLSLLLILLIFGSCSEQKKETSGSDPFWDGKKQLLLLDFEGESLSNEITSEDAEISIVNTNATSGSNALKVTYHADTKAPEVSYVPNTPIDASSLGNFALVFDAANLTEVYSAQIFVTIVNDKGHSVRRFNVIGPGEAKTFYGELKGEYISEETGLRDDPAPFDNESSPLKIAGLKNKIDFSKIAEIHFKLAHPIESKTLVIDNIRLVETPPIADDYLIGIVDKYGQNAKQDFGGKISSDEELKELADAELALLAKEGTMSERSKFGGWSKGPKLEATGYFRTEKVNGKWAMVDPEGYLFFSTGIANVRMANTTTFTGRDFKNDTVRYRDPEDVTPEDSRGMVKLSKEVTSTSYDAYPWRTKMFLGLPSYDDPLANNYSYRREQHIGPFAHGETFSHYQANLERRYGEPTEDAHLEKWVDVTLDRFLNWGFTSFGNWAGYEFYHENRMPYFANGWVIGDFKTVSSGADYWGPMPDVFDPEFERRAKVTVKVVAEEVRNNPWCIGVFIDNEKSWGLPGSINTQYAIMLDALSKDAKDSPVKAEFVSQLKEKYASISKLNTAWETSLPNWNTLVKGVDYKKKEKFSEGQVEDLSVMLEAYATKYFQVVHDALEDVMPNHLYLGCRFASWGMSKETRAAAKKYVDVFSYNFYEEAIGTSYWKFLEEIDRPSLIGEFHMGTTNSGVFHPGIVMATDQEDRARMYVKYMQTVIDNPYFVGAHWFQYLDSPTSGRAHDGENYNVGFVRITDVPYAPMVREAKKLNSSLYSRRFGK